MHIVRAVEDSLRRLRTDRIDLYQIHSVDPETPMDETLRALDDLVRSGKVLYLGVSNHPAWQIALALGLSARHSWSRFDCVQPRYNLLFRDIDAELLPLCRNQGSASSRTNLLAGGFLTGKYATLETVAGHALQPRQDGGTVSRALLAPGAARRGATAAGVPGAARQEVDP
jgi:aryl-alcohol dehydrogenase-like predicted oxidoreductase